MSNNKRWTIDNDLLKDQDGNIIAVITDSSEKTNLDIIKIAPQAIKSIQDFVDKVNSGEFKPRKAVREFEKILEKYKEG